MSETVLSILIYLHLIFITIWVGGQIMLAAVVMPSLRAVEDRGARLAYVERVTRMFGFVGGFAMLAIVLTGGLMVGERIDQVAPGDASIFDRRWGWIFVIKMTVWVAMIGVVGIHTFFVGPRQLDLNRRAIEQGDPDSPTVRAARRTSVMISALGLLLTLVVLGAGAFLGNHLYSFAAS